MRLARRLRALVKASPGDVRHTINYPCPHKGTSVTHCGLMIPGQHPEGTEIGSGRPCPGCATVREAW